MAGSRNILMEAYPENGTDLGRFLGKRSRFLTIHVEQDRIDKIRTERIDGKYYKMEEDEPHDETGRFQSGA